VEVNSKNDLINLINKSRDRIEKKITSLDREQMLTPGVTGLWSVKDIMAHIVAWETLMQEWLDMIINEGNIPSQLANPSEINWFDEVNEQIYQQNKDRPLDEVLSSFHNNKDVVLDYVSKLPEEVLFDASRYFYREGRPLWIIVEANTFGHYAEHLPDIEKFSWNAAKKT